MKKFIEACLSIIFGKSHRRFGSGLVAAGTFLMATPDWILYALHLIGVKLGVSDQKPVPTPAPEWGPYVGLVLIAMGIGIYVFFELPATGVLKLGKGLNVNIEESPKSHVIVG